MHVLMIDGHPDENRLLGDLLDIYQAGLPWDTRVARIAIRDLDFDPVLHRGYDVVQELEPDLETAWQAMLMADHIVVAFPLWWGGEPAKMKGFWDRLLLPTRAFDTTEGILPVGLLAGRSSDVLVTMGGPPLLLRTVLFDPIAHRMKRQVLGFCGISPVRTHYFGPADDDAAKDHMDGWRRRLLKIAGRAPDRWRGKKVFPKDE